MIRAGDVLHVPRDGAVLVVHVVSVRDGAARWWYRLPDGTTRMERGAAATLDCAVESGVATVARRAAQPASDP